MSIMVRSSRQSAMLVLLLCTLVISADACSKKKGTRRSSVPPPATTSATGSCACVPLHECSAMVNVLRGPKPIGNEMLRALQKATCYPVREIRNPNVRCCDEFMQPITEDGRVLPETSTTSTSVLVDNWDELPSFSECGVCGQEALVQRIVGGIEAGLGQFPWIARLGYAAVGGDADSAVYQCGGALISSEYVVTAAHCVVIASRTRQARWVRLGEHDESTEEDCDLRECALPTQDVPVQAWRAHPEYDAKTYRHDIAVVRLERPVKFTRWVHAICLPPPDLGDVTGRSGVVAGWGTTEPGVPTGSPVLQALWKKLMGKSNCTRRYRGISDIQAGQVCAGGVKGEDSCAGDSGGPLALPLSPAQLKLNSSGVPRYTLIGVVSFGARLCGAGDLPGVYTSTEHYLPWIKRAVASLGREHKRSLPSKSSARRFRH